ncbi:MAG: type II toxin-antitoxin system VapC family toxin [Gammaproteobacteria bacterium]|nr:MAG: type II toxin-antitoxin system VapC family toxin [Gammaproteobacteria bacterium]
MRGVLVDSCVLLDVFEDDPQWYSWSVAQLERYSETHTLLINPVIYAEISIGFERIEDLERHLGPMRLNIEPLRKESLFLAGKAFLAYRRGGGQRSLPLPDFFIGAQAAVEGWPLMTRDVARFRTYFPTLELVCPDST